MSKMKDLWLEENEPSEEEIAHMQAGITRDTMERMKAWIAKGSIK